MAVERAALAHPQRRIHDRAQIARVGAADVPIRTCYGSAPSQLTRSMCMSETARVIRSNLYPARAQRRPRARTEAGGPTTAIERRCFVRDDVSLGRGPMTSRRDEMGEL